MSATQVINQPLIRGEIDMQEFIRQHQIPECTGQIIQLYKIQISQKILTDPSNPNSPPSKVTNKYLTNCFRFFNNETKSFNYYAANKISFTNQLCSIAKAQQGNHGKPPKLCVLRFKAMTRDEIASGDYVMPSTDGLSEDKAMELKAKYEKNINDLVAANALLINFHAVWEYEWQAYNSRLRNGIKNESTGEVKMYLTSDDSVASTILKKVKIDKPDGTSEMKDIEPRYTWKIPVFTPHSKTSQRALQYAGRLGQVFMNSDEFIPAVLDMDASKKANAEGKKGLVEARLVGTKNGQPYSEPITHQNVSKFITRKSRIGGYIDCSQSIISQKAGHNCKILAPHNIVKRHKTIEHSQELSEEKLEECFNLIDGFADLGEDNFNFDSVETPNQTKQQSMPIYGDTSELNNIPVNIGGGLQAPQVQQFGAGQQNNIFTGSPQQLPKQFPNQQGQPTQQFQQGQPTQQFQQGQPNQQYLQMMMQNRAQS